MPRLAAILRLETVPLRRPGYIELEQLEKLCALQCTDRDIASFLGVDIRTIERRKKKPAFAAAMERRRAHGRVSLRRKRSGSIFKLRTAGRPGGGIPPPAGWVAHQTKPRTLDFVMLLVSRDAPLDAFPDSSR